MAAPEGAPVPGGDFPAADVGVIGGSGFYSLLDDARALDVDTPYGRPSDLVSIGTVAGRSVAFLPRHGADHRYPPHLVPYRANLWAFRSLGVRHVVSMSAVGSLRRELGPGSFVTPNQIVDRTAGRPWTYNDAAAGVAHVSFADPFCSRGRQAVRTGADAIGTPLVDAATLVVVNGPRFSTRAESQEFQAAGWSIIGMTAMPEAGLARELALCYTTIALVTDLDAGVEAGGGVTHAEVLEQFAANLSRLRELLVATVAGLPTSQDGCTCADVYADVPPPFALP